MDKLIELVRESVVGQLLLVVMFGGSIVYLVVTGKPVPDDMWKLLYAVVSFYFGSKAQAVISRAR